MWLYTVHLVERDCKFATFWAPGQESVPIMPAYIFLDAQEHLLFPKLC